MGKTAAIHYKAEIYDDGYSFRRGVQIVATDDTGKRRYVFACTDRYGREYKTPYLKLQEWIDKSGLNKTDSRAIIKALRLAEIKAEELNQAENARNKKPQKKRRRQK
jgi:hypothetical protein